MKRNWYVEIPRWNGGETHPRYWRVVSAEARSEQDEMYRTELTKNGSGEWVPTTAWYWPFPDQQACERFIARNLRKWEGRNE